MTHSAATVPKDQTQLAIEQLCKENAELRQMVAALLIIVSDGYGTEYVTTYDALVNWAFEEFDEDVLRDVLAEYVDDEPDTFPSEAVAASQEVALLTHQKNLFSTEDADGETSA